MATPVEAAALIRFALAQLPAHSSHHTFEEICRHLARQFICSNVLPATGPVSAGGDQGRDFETFRTYLRKELGPHAGFLGLVSEGTIAFVCTTQSEGVPAKVTKDIAKIRASGHPVHEIRAFSLASVPVAARHKLESETQQQHAIRLEFFDAEAITELLATPEGFWIAEQFLALPADVRPSQQLDDEDLSAWYLELRSRWREKRTPDPTFGDLIDMKAGLREATFRREARADLPFWLGLIREMLADPALPVPARQRARYELVVATLRGLGDLRPVDEVSRAYLNDSLTESEPARIEDASVLLMYAKGAALGGLTTIGASELLDWHAGLRRQVEHLMVGAAPHRRAGLLFTLGHLGVHPALTEEELPDTTKDLPDMVDWDRNVPSITIPDGMMLPDDAFVDVHLAMSAWTELAREDLCIAPTRVTVLVEQRPHAVQGTGEKIKALPSNDGRLWKVRLASAETSPGIATDPRNINMELLSALTYILLEVSLLPQTEFMAIIKGAFQRGLESKLALPRPYDELAEVVPDEHYAEMERNRLSAPWDCLGGSYAAHADLGWQERPGPTFSSDKAEEMLRNRYRTFAGTLRKTVPALRRSGAVRGTVEALRLEGWLDWHILTAIHNIVMNYRHPVTTRDLRRPHAREEMVRAAFEPEAKPLS